MNRLIQPVPGRRLNRNKEVTGQGKLPQFGGGMTKKEAVIGIGLLALSYLAFAWLIFHYPPCGLEMLP